MGCESHGRDRPLRRRGSRPRADRVPGGSADRAGRRLGLAGGPDPRGGASAAASCRPAPGRGTAQGRGAARARARGRGMTEVRQVRRALLSVARKEGLVPLAQTLSDAGTTLVSSGTTAKVLREAGIEVTPVSEITGFPEMLGGRVKTLHPRVHAGILADRRDPDHVRQLEEQEIEPFDLVVVNLYPFRETVASGATPDEIVEQIDIGGAAPLRAAAKNFESVGVVVRPERYPQVIDELEREGWLTRETRHALAAEAFTHTAAYDAAIASWFAGRAGDLPPSLHQALQKIGDLRYGDNPHKRATLYTAAGTSGPLGGAEVLQGKEMSFNNWLDADAARGLAAALPSTAAVIVKHNNPCGAAVGDTLEQAYRKALESDPLSAFG